MKKKLLQYLGQQTKENFLELRKQVLESASYSPYSEDLQQMETLYIEEQYQELITKARASFPNLLLSPKLHLLLSLAHGKLEQSEDAKMEQMIFAACIKGIQLTGEGTLEKPYLVCRSSDEYDLIMALQKNSQVQSLQEHEDKLIDRQQLDDGEEMFFDVTLPMKKLDELAKASVGLKDQPAAESSKIVAALNSIEADTSTTILKGETVTKRAWWKFW